MTTIEDAKKTAAVIVKKLNPHSIVLFGSVARDGIGADLDLLIITDDRSSTGDNPSLVLQKGLKKLYRKFPIDPFIIPKSLLFEYYSKGSPFLNLISKEGRALYMRDSVKEWLHQSEDEYKMEAGLLPLGEPSKTDAEKAVGLAKRILKNTRAALKK